MRKKQTPQQAKKRGQKMYERMFANARLYRWKIIAQHAISMMTTGKPLFESADLIRARNAEKKRNAEIETITAPKVQQITATDPGALFRTPVSEPSPQSVAPSGQDYTYPHRDVYDIYRYHDVPSRPTDSGSEPPPQHPQD
jgi:hypothetical protein